MVPLVPTPPPPQFDAPDGLEARIDRDCKIAWRIACNGRIKSDKLSYRSVVSDTVLSSENQPNGNTVLSSENQRNGNTGIAALQQWNSA